MEESILSNKMILVVEKIVEFNNCGVDCMCQNEPGVAWHLFKGAVELKILSQLYATAPYAGLVRANSFVAIAEALVAQQQGRNGGVPLEEELPSSSSETGKKVIDEKETGGDGSLLSGDQLPSTTRTTFCRQKSSPSAPSSDMNHHRGSGCAWSSRYEASIIARSCRLELPPPSKSPPPLVESSSSTVSSGILVYNLALTEHLSNPVNGQPLVLYHVAASMLDQNRIADQLLYQVILNNTGAYYWENNMVDAAQSTMRHLRTMLIAAVGDDPPPPRCYSCSDCESLETMRRNIQNILAVPRLTISPAA
jgi:hypothetical protein